MNQDDITKLFFPEIRKHDTHVFGVVQEINADKSYQVKLNTSTIATRATACCEAAVGDRVLVLIMANGRCAAIAKVRTA